MKATACLGHSWSEIIILKSLRNRGEPEKNEGIIQNNTLLWGVVLAIDAMACTSKTIGVKTTKISGIFSKAFFLKTKILSKAITPDMGVSKNSGTPNWMIYKGKPY